MNTDFVKIAHETASYSHGGPNCLYARLFLCPSVFNLCFICGFSTSLLSERELRAVEHIAVRRGVDYRCSVFNLRPSVTVSADTITVS